MMRTNQKIKNICQERVIRTFRSFKPKLGILNEMASYKFDVHKNNKIFMLTSVICFYKHNSCKQLDRLYSYKKRISADITDNNEIYFYKHNSCKQQK